MGHLVAILDWYLRYVVSWQLDQTLELPFVLRNFVFKKRLVESIFLS